jgi:hypothetical protein
VATNVAFFIEITSKNKKWAIGFVRIPSTPRTGVCKPCAQHGIRQRERGLILENPAVKNGLKLGLARRSPGGPKRHHRDQAAIEGQAGKAMAT